MDINNYFYFIIIIILLLMTCSIVYISYKNGISPMPSNYIMHIAVLKVLHQFTDKVTVLDAGSGFGHLIFKLASQYPRHHYIGIENSFVPYLFANVLKRLVPSYKHLPITFRYADMYKSEFSECDVIICYLYTAGVQKLYEEISRQKRSLTIISVAFAINHLEPVSILTCQDVFKTKVYVYKI